MVEDSSPKYCEDTGKTKKTYDGFKEEDNAQLLNNLTSWLSKKESTPNLAKSGVKLDKTVLHDFEQPQNSTEPQKEPWSQPPEGYHWYDRSTFAPGSYGSTKSTKADGDKQPGDQPAVQNVAFAIPKDVQANTPFNITINLSQLPANQSLDNLKLEFIKMVVNKSVNFQRMVNHIVISAMVHFQPLKSIKMAQLQ